jgi:hypothetical protein
VSNHGLDEYKASLAKNTADVYKHFDTGFVMLHHLNTGETALTSAAIDNIYPLKMWRYIRSILKNRDTQILIKCTSNFDMWIKHSGAYGGAMCDDGIVVFPVKQKG